MRIPGLKQAAIALGLAALLVPITVGQDILPPPGIQAEAPLPQTPVPQADPMLQAQPLPSQKTEVELKREDYKSDWKQAGDGEGRLGDQLRSHVIRLNDDNALTGKITVIEGVTGDLTPIEAVKIRFIRKGEVKATTTPKIDGSFSVKELDPGVYSMIAAGREGFLAWSVNIVPRAADTAKLPKTRWTRHLLQIAKDSLVIEAAAVPPTNFVPLKALLRGYLPSEESTLYMDGADIPPDMDAPPRDARPASSLKHHQVRLSKDGRLLGRIRRMQPDTGRDLRIRQLNVFLLKDNQNIAQEPVAPNGTFAFDDLRPGVYSMVAAGRDGFLAFSIDVLNPPNTEATVPRRKRSVVSTAFRVDQNLNLAIDIALCSPEDLNPTNLAMHTDDFANSTDGSIADAGPVGSPSGFSGGGFGGGPMAGAPGGGSPGGFGGGTVGATPGPGLGGILIGAATGGVIAGTLNDDDSRGIASPASPGNSTTEEEEEETDTTTTDQGGP